jgi:hypothetical protein
MVPETAKKFLPKARYMIGVSCPVLPGRLASYGKTANQQRMWVNLSSLGQQVSFI